MVERVWARNPCHAEIGNARFIANGFFISLREKLEYARIDPHEEDEPSRPQETETDRLL